MSLKYALLLIFSHRVFALLYPKESEIREVKSLDGVWKFRLSPSLKPDTGFDYQWYSNQSVWAVGHNIDSDGGSRTLQMPVPSSFNDISTEASIRDFVGWAWYYRTFFVPKTWKDKVSCS